MESNIPAWGQMWLLAILIYAVCKAAVWMRLRECSAPYWKQAAFLLAWPGMDANEFVGKGSESTPRRDLTSETLWAIASQAFGAILFWFAAPQVSDEQVTLIAWLGMLGTISMLHFGAFRLLANYWQSKGIAARPIMIAPWTASSVSEFWGQRWNTGFRDLAAQCIFRPVARRAGVASATWAVFLFSGVVHDLVISLPAGAGYGGPMLYFVIQAMAVQFEHTELAGRLGMRSAIGGRLLTLVAVLAPVDLLFHAPFRTHVIIPFMEAFGAR
jgi:hypothetical protein